MQIIIGDEKAKVEMALMRHCPSGIWHTDCYAHRMGGFPLAAMFGLALGFLFGVGCAAAVMYTVFLSGYRAALRDVANGGNSDRYRGQMRRLK